MANTKFGKQLSQLVLASLNLAIRIISIIGTHVIVTKYMYAPRSPQVEYAVTCYSFPPCEKSPCNPMLLSSLYVYMYQYLDILTSIMYIYGFITDHGDICTWTHSTAKVGWLLNTGMSFALTDLTTDLVKLEKEVVFLCQFGRQFNLDFFIEFWLPEWKAILLILHSVRSTLW